MLSSSKHRAGCIHIFQTQPTTLRQAQGDCPTTHVIGQSKPFDSVTNNMHRLFWSVFIFTLFFFSNCTSPSNIKVDIKGELLLRKEVDYPSGSAIMFHDDKLYLMGDDAQGLLILDTLFNNVGTLPVFGASQERIFKPIKPDIESSEIINNNLWLLGSGSVKPFRDSLIRINLSTKAIQKLSLKSFYDTLRTNIKTLNIEGLAKVKKQIALGHRRSNLDPQNYLITFPSGMLETNNYEGIKIIRFIATSHNLGISGMTYYNKKDMLFITSSREDTQNSYDDGLIGESNLSIITKASKKLDSDSLIANNNIPLSLIHQSFKNIKVESIAIAGVKGNTFTVYLAADNDDGKTSLFKVKLTLN